MSLPRRAAFDTHEIADIAAGAIVASTLLVAEHILLWPWRGRVPQLALYALGVLAINTGVTRMLLARGRQTETAGLWIITGMAGLTTGILHGWRAMQHRRQREQQPWPLEALDLPPSRTRRRRHS